ncbi:MAG: hypothetical protein KAH10_09255, partial [Flavobacteriales bacterium]|nr:hypothetical protein [Flavobacteriales bacterium]
MRNLKRLAASLVAMMLVVAFTSCEKQTAKIDKGLSEVVININNVTDNIKKSGDQIIPECSDSVATHAVVTGVDPLGNPVLLELPILQNLENGTQTVVIKTQVLGTYTITGFEVYSNADMIWAAPKPDSDFYQWTDPERRLDLDFEVVAFKKLKVDIDVMCIDESTFESFGYFWFEFHKIAVRELCFFGDVCTKFYEDFHTYEGSPYIGQDYDGYDFPAIFKVLIKDSEGNVINDEEFNTNEEWFGTGKPLCIQYPDRGNDEMFTFEVYLAYPDGTWPLVYTSEPFNASDDMSAITGDDGIFDFVVGNCSYEGNDHNMELPPYLMLPDHGRIGIANWGHESEIYNDYFEIDLISGFDNPLYPKELKGPKTYGYCGDLYNYINAEEYDVDIYSSLTAESIALMPEHYRDIPWGALNYLANLDIDERTIEIAKQVQASVWFIIHGITPMVGYEIKKLGGIPSQAAKDLAQRCLDNSDYKIKTGDWVVLA